jgi:hypothetical protein
MILRPEALRICEAAYRQAAREDVALVKQWAGTIPDLWDLFWVRGVYQAPELPNLTCLRSFVSERNIFSTRCLHEFYLTLPASQRRGRRLIKEALALSGKGVVGIPHSDTWLPLSYPEWMHHLSHRAREVIARARRIYLARRGSSNTGASSSWPNIGRLWSTNAHLRALMEELIRDTEVLPNSFIDRQIVKTLWADQLNGSRDYTILLNPLISMYIYLKNFRARIEI